MLKFFTHTPTVPQPKPLTIAEIDRSDAVIELIFAGNTLLRHLQFPGDDGPECLCGARMNSYPNKPEHARFCPAERFLAAVEKARKVAIS